MCLVALLLVQLVACGEADAPMAPVDIVEQLREEGRSDAALTTLRNAMRSAPDDPQLRLLLAEVYLDLGQGALASVALDQAIERGLLPTKAMLPRARALLAEKRYREIGELGVSESLKPGHAATIYLIKAEARIALATNDDGFDVAVTRDVLALLEFIERYPTDQTVSAVATELARLRESRADVERAWQHYSCRSALPGVLEWRPLDRSAGRALEVGRTREFKTIRAAAAAARDGDTVAIDPGHYPGDVAIWPQNNLIVRGVGERPVISSEGETVEGRDVWLFTGDNVVVENVEISGARSRHRNGAGIRHTGSGLSLRHVYLHDNENGLLTGNKFADSNSILIEFSEFARNGDGKGFAHNIYVGKSSRFELRFSYSHAAIGGHLVKSRAKTNVIAYNRLTDGDEGSSSYLVDIPLGGSASIIGNVMEQGAQTLNHGMLSYAGEGLPHPDNHLLVGNNSVYNRDFRGVFIRNHKDQDVTLINNLFGGAGVASADGQVKSQANLTQPDHGMIDPRNYNFALAAGATGIDRGVSYDHEPEYEYRHPVRASSRLRIWKTDVGAYERCGL